MKSKSFILCNAVFLLYYLTRLIQVSDFITALLVSLIIFVIPGIGWIGLIQKRIVNSVVYIFYVLLFSTIIITFLLLILRFTNIEPTLINCLGGLIVFTNLGLFFSRPVSFPQIQEVSKKTFIISLLSMILIFCCIYVGMKSIPALRDLDGEHQGTAYGFIYELKPYATSDILPVVYYFSHPTLTNFYNAYSILLFGELDEFKFYYNTAKNTEQILQSAPREEIKFQLKDLDYKVVNVDNSDYFLSVINPITKRVQFQSKLSKDNLVNYFYEQDRQKFNTNPQIFSTRACNIFASIFIFWIFVIVITSLTGSQYLGILGGIIYIFTPGIFIRSCFSAHFAFTNCFFLLLAYQYIDPKQFTISKDKRGLLLIIPGIIAAFVNQKILIILGAIIIARGVQFFSSHKKSLSLKQFIRDEPIIPGYLLGTLLFWVYGLLIDHQAFILSHIRVHTIDRLFHINTMFAEDYPSIPRLWMEFIIEFPYFLLALMGVVFGIQTYFRDRINIFLLWFFCGAITFSIVDWRLTDHLVYIVPPLIIVLMIFISKQRKIIQNILILCIFICLTYSFWLDAALVRNFKVYLPTGGW